MEKVNSSIK